MLVGVRGQLSGRCHCSICCSVGVHAGRCASQPGRVLAHLGIFGPDTKNTTFRSRPPGLKRLGTAPLDVGQRGRGGLEPTLTTSGFVIASACKIISGPNRPEERK